MSVAPGNPDSCGVQQLLPPFDALIGEPAFAVNIFLVSVEKLKQYQSVRSSGNMIPQPYGFPLSSGGNAYVAVAWATISGLSAE